MGLYIIIIKTIKLHTRINTYYAIVFQSFKLFSTILHFFLQSFITCVTTFIYFFSIFLTSSSKLYLKIILGLPLLFFLLFLLGLHVLVDLYSVIYNTCPSTILSCIVGVGRILLGEVPTKREGVSITVTHHL